MSRPTTPALLYTPARIAALKDRLARLPSVRDRWQKLRDAGQKLLAAPLVPETDASKGAGQHANFGAAASAVVQTTQTLGLLNFVEPDARYIEKMRQTLLHYATYSRWCAPSFDQRKPAWHSELVTAEVSYGYALGLHLLRDTLSPIDRSTIASALVDKGIRPILNDWLLPELRIHALDSMGHNWWMVMLSMAGIGALALLDDHPEAPAWLDALEQAFPEWFTYAGMRIQNKPANFDSAGGYYEGINYVNYALREYMLFRVALLDVFPDRKLSDEPILRRSQPFMLHNFYPTADGFLNVNFGDAHINAAGTTAMRLMHAQGLAVSHASWYIHHTTQDATQPATQPLAIVFEPDVPTPAPQGLPTSAFFPGTSWATMRTSWEDNATLLAMHAGIFWGHAHADSGSFILYHCGQQLIIDPGHCEYANPAYKNYYVASDAHNVVLVNGKGALSDDFLRGSKFPGSLHSLLDAGGLKYIYADATGPLAHLLSRHYRHWIWTDGVIVVFDDLLAHNPSRFNWLLHYSGTATTAANSATLRNGNAEATVEFLHPRDLAVREVPAPAQDNANAQQPYLEHTTATPQRQQNFVTLITPHDPSHPAARAEFLSGPEYLGVRLSSPGTITDIYFNQRADGRSMHSNSNNIMEGWDTDAYLLAIIRPASARPEDVHSITRLLIVAGSYVRRGDTVLLDSLSKLDALFVHSPTTLDVQLHGQPRGRLAYHLAQAPRTFTLNGAAHPFAFDARLHMLRTTYNSAPAVAGSSQ